MDRQRLRKRVYRRHARYDREKRRSIATCPLTNTPLVDHWDLHEVFVKRNAVRPDAQHLIMVVENCIPVQHEAHIKYGNSKEALAKCTLRMFQRCDAHTIGEWYVSLWREHGLSVDKGILASPKDLSVRHLVRLIEVGAQMDGVQLPWVGWEYDGAKGVYDIRAQVALRYQDKRRKWREKIPEHHNGFEIGQLLGWMDAGYWATYMCGVMGLKLDDILDQ